MSNLELELYQIFENYIETFCGYERDMRCVPEEVIEGLILDIIEYIETKQ